MRKLYAIVCMTLLSTAYQAQETLPYYQQYLMDGEFLFNPAHYGETDDFHVNLNYQKQFSKFSESPNVQSIGVHANVFDRVGAGLHFFRDSNGPISANGVTAGASYFIPLSDEGERQDQFSFGTSVTAYSMNFDYSAINTENGSDPLLQGEQSDIFMVYANFGVAAKYRNVFGGASVNDIALNNDQSIVNAVEPSPIKIFLNLGYDWHFAENMYVTPSVLVNLNTNSSIMIDGNVMATVHNDFNSFSAGASYRYIQNRFDNQTLSIAPVIKAKLDRYVFSATYNIGLSDIQDYGGNSFMIGVGLNFENFINRRGFRY
ncbi:MAG: PorP/SprF family type IX secretion system membrane protein [Kaistella sp.]|nr:PorP/SprF family type IX secretion system membrane protein [Kaistella sp.]